MLSARTLRYALSIILDSEGYNDEMFQAVVELAAEYRIASHVASLEEEEARHEDLA